MALEPTLSRLNEEVGVKNPKDGEVEGVRTNVSNPSTSSLVVYALDRLCACLVVAVWGGEGGCNSIGGKRGIGISAAVVEGADCVRVGRGVLSFVLMGKKVPVLVENPD